MTKENKLKNPFVWQNWVHYLALAIGLSVFLYLAGASHVITDIDPDNFPEQAYKVLDIPFGDINIMINLMNFVWLYIAIFAIDTIIHYIFASLPKPYRWVD